MSPSSSRTADGFDIAAVGRGRMTALLVPIGEKLAARWMFHVIALPRRLRSAGHFCPAFAQAHSPRLLCRTGFAASMPGTAFCALRRRLCGVNVKLTMRLAAGAEPARVRAFPFAPVVSRVPAVAYTGGVKQFGHRAGRGGDVTRPGATRSAGQGGCSQHPPFSLCALLFALCTCTARPKPPIWAASLGPSRRLRSSTPWNPFEIPSQAPQDPPREPILTLPGALTAYVAAARGHPPAGAAAAGSGELDHRRLRLHPEALRFNAAARSIFPAAPAPRSGPSSPIRCCTPISAISSSTCCGCCRSAARWRGGSARSRFFLFMAVTAAAGALAHLVTHEHAIAPMIGASASVSGAMAAAIRFAFVKGSFLSFSRGDADEAARVPALSLSRALRNARVLGFLAVWFGVNIVFGDRIDRDRRRRRERRLAGAYRRISSRA